MTTQIGDTRPHSLHWDSSLPTSGRIWALVLLEPILFEVFLSSKFWFWVAVTTVTVNTSCLS